MLVRDMIHELIDPKKKTNRARTSKNTKTFQEPKTVTEEINFEASDSENKESSSTIFIPPWLRNSLRLNQRNNLSNATGGTDLKSTKLIQRAKEPSHNEFECLKANVVEQECCIKVTDHFEFLPQDSPENINVIRGSDNAETADDKNDRTIPIYWDARQKESEIEWSCTNAETKPLKTEESKMISTDVLTTADVEKLKEDDKKRLKFLKQKNKVRKRIVCDSKQCDLDKNEMDFLLEMKAREALDNYMKGDIHSVSSEIKHLEAKLLLLSSKSHDLSNLELNQQDLRVRQEIKAKAAGSVEQLDSVFEHAKDVNLKGIVRNCEFLSKNGTEKKREEKEGKPARDGVQACDDDSKSKAEKDSLLSTDDENDIKRFSEFLSKNKNLEEKRKCLEEVRNYFEKKRRTRLTKRRCLEEGKAKVSAPGDRKEEQPKEKAKSREIYRGRRSKFALCDEEVVEKAVDEALQKFVELYHFRVTPSVMGNMKKNILKAIATDSLESSKLSESASVTLGDKNIKLELLQLREKLPEKREAHSYAEAEMLEIPSKDISLHKDLRKRNGKNLNESLGEQVSELLAEVKDVDSERLKRLKKEFDIFLHSVQNHIDVTNLKLQSIILEKEEQTASTQNVQFVYNFTKKALEPEKTGQWQSLKEDTDSKKRKDGETQTAADLEPARRNVKIQALEHKFSCEQSLQTETKTCATQDTQTDDGGMTVQEIKELKSYDVNSGLYRMVRSKEAGKFYLYPEQVDSKQDFWVKSSASVSKDSRKFNKKRSLVTIGSKERMKERQAFLKDREKQKMKKTKRTSSKKEKEEEEMSENSISCLYFRNFDNKCSGSISSKKEAEYAERLTVADDLAMVSSKGDHLGGCFWFWDGEKISPGCDLKTHVENLLKEKLKQITSFCTNQNELVPSGMSFSKNKSDQMLVGKVSEKNIDARNSNAIFCIGNARNATKQNAKTVTENEALEERKRIVPVEEPKGENEEKEQASASEYQQKTVKNVNDEGSHLKLLTLNPFKHKIPSGISASVRRKCNRRNIVIKPSQGRAVNIKKAEDFLRTVEEIKKIKMELERSKKENSSESESLLDCSTSTPSVKNAGEDPLSVVLGLKENPEVEEISNVDIKNKLKTLISLVDREVQTYNAEDANSVENNITELVMNNQKHLDLIGSVLGKVGQKQRENLWNDVRNFIKTKLGKDINEAGAREVCIEIEQNVPEVDQGKKNAVMAKGHYTKNEGDVEVEIDLTLEDLARILRQRQRKNRRRNAYRSSKSKNLLSSSSVQSDFTREDIRRYQKYLHRFATLGEGLPEDKEPKTLKKHKGN